MSPDDHTDQRTDDRAAGPAAGRLVLKEQPLPRPMPHPLPAEAAEPTSNKAWSPIPMDLNGLIDRERMALISPIEGDHPDLPTGTAAPLSPGAMSTAEAPSLRSSDPTDDSSAGPAHPAAIANHLTTHNGFVTSDRAIGLKLTKGNGPAGPAPQPNSAATKRMSSGYIPPQPNAGPQPSGAPSGIRRGAVEVHPDSIDTLPQPPVLAAPAVADAPGQTGPGAPTTQVATTRASSSAGLDSAGFIGAPSIGGPAPEKVNDGSHEIGQRLPGEADESGIVAVPAIGVARSFGSDPNAGKVTPLATPGAAVPGVFDTAPSGPPTALPDIDAQPMDRGIDWRLPTLGLLAAAYLPAVARSVLALHPTNILGFGILSLFFVPLVFVVSTARRSVIAPATGRNGDLAMGAALGTGALVCSLLLPRLLGSTANQWRTELLGLPLALASAVVLLWGRRFARDVREALATAGLAAPVLASPVLLSGPFPFGGGTNPVSMLLARLLVPITKVGEGIYAVGAQSNPVTVDIHRINSLRSLILAVGFVCTALLLTSKVDPTKPGAAALTDNERQARMVVSLILTLLAALALDTVLGLFALAGGHFVPQKFISGLTSTPAVCILFGMVALSVTRWCRLTGLFIPTLRGIKRAPMKLPEPGPRSTVDRIIVIGSVGLLMISALGAGLFDRSYLTGTKQVDTEQTTMGHLTLPSGYTLAESTNPDVLRTYLGSRSTWTRLQFDDAQPNNAGHLHFDIVSARRQQLTTFPLVSLYELNGYRPVRSQVIDLGGGASGLRETFYDPDSASIWTAVSFLVNTGSGDMVEKVVISATGPNDPAPAPEPAGRAFASLLLLPVSLPAGANGELTQGRAALIEDTVAGIARDEISALRAAAAAPPVGGPVATDPAAGDPSAGGPAASDQAPSAPSSAAVDFAST